MKFFFLLFKPSLSSDIALLTSSACEHVECLPKNSEFCYERLIGFYKKYKSCPKTHTCTECQVSNYDGENKSTVLLAPRIQCKCHKSVEQLVGNYGDQCNWDTRCKEPFICHRPCRSYLSAHSCPLYTCVWDINLSLCSTRKELYTDVSNQIDNPFIADIERIFSDLNNIILTSSNLLVVSDNPHENMFTNHQNLRALSEFELSPEIHSKVDNLLKVLVTTYKSNGKSKIRNLKTCSNGKTWCEANNTCLDNCETCSIYIEVVDGLCVLPSPDTCKEIEKFYCLRSYQCVEDCVECRDLKSVQTSLNLCVAPWWSQALNRLPGISKLENNTTIPQPYINIIQDDITWRCVLFNKPGQICNDHIDCGWGIRRCVAGICLPKHLGAKCIAHADCDHLTAYCDFDPANPKCVRKREDGEHCHDSYQCAKHYMCNSINNTCVKLFSLPINYNTNIAELCITGFSKGIKSLFLDTNNSYTGTLKSDIENIIRLKIVNNDLLVLLDEASSRAEAIPRLLRELDLVDHLPIEKMKRYLKKRFGGTLGIPSSKEILNFYDCSEKAHSKSNSENIFQSFTSRVDIKNPLSAALSGQSWALEHINGVLSTSYWNESYFGKHIHKYTNTTNGNTALIKLSETLEKLRRTEEQKEIPNIKNISLSFRGREKITLKKPPTSRNPKIKNILISTTVLHRNLSKLNKINLHYKKNNGKMLTKTNNIRDHNVQLITDPDTLELGDELDNESHNLETNNITDDEVYNNKNNSGYCSNPPISLALGKNCSNNEECKTTLPDFDSECICYDWWTQGNARSCKPVLGDYIGNGERKKDLIWQIEEHCGKHWTLSECLKHGPRTVLIAYYKLLCETQMLTDPIERTNCGVYLQPCEKLYRIVS